MANAYKVLGQLSDASAGDVTLVADQNGEVIVSTIVVCNRASAERQFRIAVRVGAAALDDKQYISYDVPVPANDTIFLTLGVTLADDDIITVGAYNAGVGASDVSFSAFGTVITA